MSALRAIVWGMVDFIKTHTPTPSDTANEQ